MQANGPVADNRKQCATEEQERQSRDCVGERKGQRTVEVVVSLAEEDRAFLEERRDASDRHEAEERDREEVHRQSVVDSSGCLSKLDPDRGEQDAHTDVHGQTNPIREKVARVVDKVATCQGDRSRQLDG